MPVGAPDGGYPSQQLASSVLDTGALGDRILMGGGSIFKAGRVVWASGFENGQATDYSFGFSAGGQSSPQLGNTFTGPNALMSAWQGNYFHLFQTGAVLSNFASFFKYFPATIQTGQWGFETMLQLDSFNTTMDFILKKVGPTGIPNSQTLTALLRLWSAGDNAHIFLYYLDNTGATQLLATISNIFAIGANVWYNAKLIVNFQTGKYVRFLWNNQIYDLSNIPMFATAPGVDEKSSAQVVLTALAAANSVAGIDNVILTADEP